MARPDDGAPDVAALDELARYYDLRHGATDADISFYQHVLGEGTGTIAELGCGTGRLLAPLALLGRPVVGVDVSRRMLERARARLTDVTTAAPVRLVQADMLALPLHRIGAAVLALNTFCHWQSQSDQLSVLSGIRDRLLSGGLLALDLPNPHMELGARPDGVATLEAVHESGAETVYEWTVTEAEAAGQAVLVRLLYDRCDRGGEMHRQALSFRLRLVYRYELELLLRAAGFCRAEFFGDYDGSPYVSDSPRLVALAAT